MSSRFLINFSSILVPYISLRKQELCAHSQTLGNRTRTIAETMQTLAFLSQQTLQSNSSLQRCMKSLCWSYLGNVPQEQTIWTFEHLIFAETAWAAGYCQKTQVVTPWGFSPSKLVQTNATQIAESPSEKKPTGRRGAQVLTGVLPV